MPLRRLKDGVLAFAGGSHQATWALSQQGRGERALLHPLLKANNVSAKGDAAVAGLCAAQLALIVAAAPVSGGQLRAVLSGWSPPKVRGFIDLAVEAMRARRP
jgi:DNA-binding transcriptional LysR family regulator